MEKSILPAAGTGAGRAGPVCGAAGAGAGVAGAGETAGWGIVLSVLSSPEPPLQALRRLPAAVAKRMRPERRGTNRWFMGLKINKVPWQIPLIGRRKTGK